MASFNEITVVGYLGRDPEIRYLPDGAGVCNFSVATTEKRKNREGESEEHTIWFKITVWGRQADACAQYLVKGQQVYVHGTLRQSEYTDRDGNPRTSLEINAQTVHFLSKSGAGDGAGDRGYEGEESRRPAQQQRAAQGSGRSASSPRTASTRSSEGIEEDEIPF